MTNEQLCALALAAIDDADARVVLADAILETGFQSDEAENLCGILPVSTGTQVYRFKPEAMASFALGCRAIAAVLLCDGYYNSTIPDDKQTATRWAPNSERSDDAEIRRRLRLQLPVRSSFDDVEEAFRAIGRRHGLGHDSEISHTDERPAVVRLLLSEGTPTAVAEEVARELSDQVPAWVYIETETRIRPRD